jgi:ABC-type sugar transport system permease subunit
MGYAATLGLFFASIILGIVIIQKKFIERNN